MHVPLDVSGCPHAVSSLWNRCRFSEMFWQILIRADISLQFSNKSLTILNFDFKLHGCARSTDVSGCPHAASNLWNRCRFSEMFWQILIRADISWQLSIKSFRTWNFGNLWFLNSSLNGCQWPCSGCWWESIIDILT